MNKKDINKLIVERIKQTNALISEHEVMAESVSVMASEFIQEQFRLTLNNVTEECQAIPSIFFLGLVLGRLLGPLKLVHDAEIKNENT